MATIIDYDGNSYETVIIGTQEWIASNWKCEHTPDGTPVSFYYPNNDIGNKENYGLLYDYNNAILLPPIGWRLPTKTDFEVLISYLGESIIAGEKMKEIGTTYWNNPNIATNSSNFNLRGNGIYYNGVYIPLGVMSSLKTSTISEPNYTYYCISVNNSASADVSSTTMAHIDAGGIRFIKRTKYKIITV